MSVTAVIFFVWMISPYKYRFLDSDNLCLARFTAKQEIDRRRICEKRKQKPTYLRVIFILYMIALVAMVLFKYGFKTGLGSLNLIPFQWVTYPQAMRFSNIFGNIAFFVQLGVLLPLLFRKMNAGKTVLAGFCLSLFFEIAQYVTDTGGADVDDLILNTCGVICGALCFLLLRKFAHSEAKLHRNGLIFVVVFGIIASVIFLFV